MQKRWYNYRPILLIFIFLMLGSLFAFYIQEQTILAILGVSAIFILVIVIAILKKKLKYLLIPVVAFIFSYAVFNLAVYSFNESVSKVPEKIEARIYSISSVKQGVMRVKADNCKFDNKSIKTNLSILIYDDEGLFENIEIGSEITFIPLKFYKSDLYYNGIPNAKTYSEDLQYTATTQIENLTITGINKSFVEQIKQQIKENLDGYLTNENVELAYSALFGEKDFLSEGQYNAYRLSGIAHLLAVSGLHVSIIVAIISKLLSLIKVKGWSKLAVISIFLLLYAYMCNFSISVIRASIMTIMVLLSSLLKREYDPLTSIGLAGSVIFCINPLCLYDISFLMSFACAFGIVLFSKPIGTILYKIKISKKIADAMAITIATLVSLIIISAYYFQNFNAISLLANLIIIPIFTFAFSIVFVVSLLGLIIPHISIVLNPLNYLFDLINVFATYLGNLKFANISTAGLNFIAIPIYFVMLFMISKICVAKHRNKIIISLPLLAILVLCLV